MKNYSVFCVAMAMPKEVQDTQSLDWWWDEACRLYEEFTESPYNVGSRSELACINDFVDNYYKNYAIISKYKKEISEYVHRINMINDDIKCVRKFIHDKNLDEIFCKPTVNASECHEHLLNIEVACDFDNDESLTWKKYSYKP